MYPKSVTYLLALLLASACWLCACTGDAEQVPDVSHIEVKLQFHRLEKELAQVNTVGQAADFLKHYPAFGRAFFLQKEAHADSSAIYGVLRLGQSTYIDTLNMEADTVFADMAPIQRQFEQAFRFVKYYYPSYNPPPVYTMITGYGTDLVVTDSAIFVGLDYFMGTRSRYRPPNDPEYIFERYRPELVVPATITMLSARFNVLGEKDNTLLSQMLAYGKAFEFAHRVLPATPDSLIIRYTSEEWNGCEANQEVIWAHFVENNLFFEKSQLAVKKYIEQRPVTNEIGAKCPGRIGTWLGWQIVRSYMREHPETTLPQLMEMQNMQQIFEQSKYRPATQQ